MQILLIEPDEIIARSYRTALEADGHRVVCVKTAQTAVQAADEAMPELVVLAVDMAQHNGIEFLYEFKSYTEWRDVPVVLMVSQLSHDLADSAILRKELGVAQVLVKTRTSLHDLQHIVATFAQGAA
jgi:two-component system KDP operon response regulator KdpE